MASRPKSSRRRDSDTDSLEALKPLVVLGLLGMILYGAYSIVQKGPMQPAAALPEAPPFAAPSQPLPTAAVADPSAVAAAPQVELPPAPAPPAPPSAAAVPSPAALAAVAAPAAVAASSAAFSPPPAADPQPPAAPTYLSAQSAPPPEQIDVAAPEVAAALPAAPAAAAPATPAPAVLPSAAFAAAWADAHDKLAAGRYAEALAVLSAWYDDASLGVEESQRLEDLLSQLAGTVIYSQQDLLLPPHVVAAGETLEAIAANHGVPWQLLAKINGVDDPQRLIPGEAIKTVRGPFDAVVSISRRRLSLQVGGNYAGVFPVVIGRRVQDRVGASLAVAEIRRDGATRSPEGRPSTAPASFVQQVAGQQGVKSVVLNDGLRIEAADDPIALADSAPEGSLIVSSRDLDELIDILGPGSHVLIRQ